MYAAGYHDEIKPLSRRRFARLHPRFYFTDSTCSVKPDLTASEIRVTGSDAERVWHESCSTTGIPFIPIPYDYHAGREA